MVLLWLCRLRAHPRIKIEMDDSALRGREHAATRLPPRPSTAAPAAAGGGGGGGVGGGGPRLLLPVGAVASQHAEAAHRRELLRGAAEGDRLLAILAGPAHAEADALLVAAEAGDERRVRQLLLSGVDPNGGNRGLRGFSPLHHACSRGHVPVAAALVRARCLVDATNASGETPLHLAA